MNERCLDGDSPNGSKTPVRDNKVFNDLKDLKSGSVAQAGSMLLVPA
jgi:hypothetical protein